MSHKFSNLAPTQGLTKSTIISNMRVLAIRGLLYQVRTNCQLVDSGRIIIRGCCRQGPVFTYKFGINDQNSDTLSLILELCVECNSTTNNETCLANNTVCYQSSDCYSLKFSKDGNTSLLSKVRPPVVSKLF